MQKRADNLLQPKLPPPAAGSMLPGPNPQPLGAPTPPKTPQSPSWTQPWNFGSYGITPGRLTANLAGSGARTIGQQAGDLTNRLFAGAGSAAAPFSAAMNNLSAPPLAHLTHHLGSAKPYADKALGFVRDNIQGPQGAQRFATFASMAKPLMEPVMATPFGAPLLAGLYGALGGRGAQGAADAATFFRPLLGKLGL